LPLPLLLLMCDEWTTIEYSEAETLMMMMILMIDVMISRTVTSSL